MGAVPFQRQGLTGRVPRLCSPAPSSAPLDRTLGRGMLHTQPTRSLGNQQRLRGATRPGAMATGRWAGVKNGDDALASIGSSGFTWCLYLFPKGKSDASPR
jgi:hypothetical protein